MSLQKELEGFVLNRLQYAIFAESWRLVASGVVNAGDLDRIVSQGLGLRYAFLGATCRSDVTHTITHPARKLQVCKRVFF